MNKAVQLEEPFPVITPLGKGYAILVDTGAHDQYWTVALDSGALVTFAQDRIRIARSYTHRRGITDEEMNRIVNGSSQEAKVHQEKDHDRLDRLSDYHNPVPQQPTMDASVTLSS